MDATPFTAENVGALAGVELTPSRRSWTAADVILYHLGIGAGCESEERVLRYVYERDLEVLPSFATAIAHRTGTAVDGIPGVELDRRYTVHGEQEIVLHRPIPLEADAVTTGRVLEVADLGRTALIRIETETRADGELLFVTRFGVALRGGGGFGVKRATPSGEAAPEGPPDLRFEVPTSTRQAMIYRLSGDRNPLHIDPVHARAVGFDGPILHGLATYGAILHGVVEHALDGEIGDIAGFTARFGAPIFPGETLVVDAWRGERAVHVLARVAERDARPVLSHAAVTLRG